jgi:hypothetical protein
MYTAFDAQVHLLDRSRIHEVRYEDLVRDPVGEMKRLYDHLDLGEFDQLRPRIDAFLKQNDGYQTNTYSVDPEVCRTIDDRWGPFMRRYGYCKDEPFLVREVG